jgi:hypothetical protein
MDIALPTYKQSIEAAGLDDYQARYRLIRERDDLRSQRDAVVHLLKIIVHHECGGYGDDVSAEDIQQTAGRLVKGTRT